jgi:hypothetical protein
VRERERTTKEEWEGVRSREMMVEEKRSDREELERVGKEIKEKKNV